MMNDRHKEEASIRIEDEDPSMGAKERAFFASMGIPVMSRWKCYLFGTTTLSFRPREGMEPNAWWRFWQWVFIGNRWIKEDDNGTRKATDTAHRDTRPTTRGIP